MLTGFILEILSGPTWRRESAVAWTRAEAEERAAKRLCAPSVSAVRILPFVVDESKAEIRDAAKGGVA